MEVAEELVGVGVEAARKLVTLEGEPEHLGNRQFAGGAAVGAPGRAGPLRDGAGQLGIRCGCQNKGC